MDRNRFFEELICWNQNYIRMINEHLNWIDTYLRVDYNLQMQQRISIFIDGCCSSSILRGDQTTEMVIYQQKFYDDQIAKKCT